MSCHGMACFPFFFLDCGTCTSTYRIALFPVLVRGCAYVLRVLFVTVKFACGALQPGLPSVPSPCISLLSITSSIDKYVLFFLEAKWRRSVASWCRSLAASNPFHCFASPLPYSHESCRAAILPLGPASPNSSGGWTARDGAARLTRPLLGTSHVMQVDWEQQATCALDAGRSFWVMPSLSLSLSRVPSTYEHSFHVPSDSESEAGREDAARRDAGIQY
ncbi:hypothetical protein J3F83DRAFT_724161 [Trichoderma novae-zelandiae]